METQDPSKPPLTGIRKIGSANSIQQVKIDADQQSIRTEQPQMESNPSTKTMSAENALSLLHLQRHLEDNADVMTAHEIMRLIRDQERASMKGDTTHLLDQKNADKFGKLPNSHVMNVLISKGWTIEKLMKANEENMIEGAFDIPEKQFKNEQERIDAAQARIQNPGSVKLHKTINSLKNSKSGAAENLGEITEFLDEDQDLNIKLKLARGKKNVHGTLNERELRYQKHVNNKKYKIHMQSQSYVNELGDSEEEEAKNVDFNKSIGSSISSGGLLEKDMTNLMDQEIAKEIRQRRKERREHIERSRLHRTASHQIITEVRNAQQNTISQGRLKSLCSPLAKLHEAHGLTIPIPHLSPTTGVMSDLKQMRNKMADLFKTDFASAAPEQEISKHMMATETFQTGQRDLRKTLTPLEERHSVEDENYSKDYLDIQVGEIFLAHSDTLADTQYSDDEDTPLDLNSQNEQSLAQNMTTDEKTKLLMQKNISQEEYAKLNPSKLLCNSQVQRLIKKNPYRYAQRMEFLKLPKAPTQPTHAMNTAQMNRIICDLEKLKKTHSSNIKSDFIDGLVRMLSERAAFNLQSAEDPCTGASRKFLLDVDSMVINSEGEILDKTSLMKKVGRKMRSIIEDDKSLAASMKRMRSGGEFDKPDGLTNKDSQATINNIPLQERKKKGWANTDMEVNLQMIRRQQPNQTPHTRKILYGHSQAQLGQFSKIHLNINPHAENRKLSNQPKSGQVSTMQGYASVMSINPPPINELMQPKLTKPSISKILQSNSSSKDIHQTMYPIHSPTLMVKQKGNEQGGLISQMKSHQPDRNISPYGTYGMLGETTPINAETSRDGSTDQGLLTIQGKAKLGGKETPISPHFQGKKESGSKSPPLSPIFMSNQNMQQQQSNQNSPRISPRISPMETREQTSFGGDKNDIYEILSHNAKTDKSIGAQDSLWKGFGQTGQNSAKDGDFTLYQHPDINNRSTVLNKMSHPQYPEGNTNFMPIAQKAFLSQKHLSPEEALYNNRKKISKDLSGVQVKHLDLVTDRNGNIQNTQLITDSRLKHQQKIIGVSKNIFGHQQFPMRMVDKCNDCHTQDNNKRLKQQQERQEEIRQYKYEFEREILQHSSRKSDSLVTQQNIQQLPNSSQQADNYGQLYSLPVTAGDGIDQKHLANIQSMNTTEKSIEGYGIEGNTETDFHKQSVKILSQIESSQDTNILVKVPQTSHEGEILATNLKPIIEQSTLNGAAATQDNKFLVNYDKHSPPPIAVSPEQTLLNSSMNQEALSVHIVEQRPVEPGNMQVASKPSEHEKLYTKKVEVVPQARPIRLNVHSNKQPFPTKVVDIEGAGVDTEYTASMQNSQTQFKVMSPKRSQPTSRQAPANKPMEPKFAHKNASGPIEAVDTSNLLKEEYRHGDEGGQNVPMSGISNSGPGGTQLVFQKDSPSREQLSLAATKKRMSKKKQSKAGDSPLNMKRIKEAVNRDVMSTQQELYTSSHQIAEGIPETELQRLPASAEGDDSKMRLTSKSKKNKKNVTIKDNLIRNDGTLGSWDAGPNAGGQKHPAPPFSPLAQRSLGEEVFEDGAKAYQQMISRSDSSLSNKTPMGTQEGRNHSNDSSQNNQRRSILKNSHSSPKEQADKVHDLAAGPIEIRHSLFSNKRQSESTALLMQNRFVKQAGPNTIYNSARLELKMEEMEQEVFKTMVRSPIGISSPVFINATVNQSRDEIGKFTSPQFRRNVQAKAAYDRRFSQQHMSVKLSANTPQNMQPSRKTFGRRVASLGVGGGFKGLTESKGKGKERERLFDTYENLNKVAGSDNYPAHMSIEEAILQGFIPQEGGVILFPSNSKKPRHNKPVAKNLSPKHPQRLVQALPNAVKKNQHVKMKMMNLDIKSQQTKSQNPGRSSMMNTNSQFPNLDHTPKNRIEERKNIPIPLSLYEQTMQDQGLKQQADMITESNPQTRSPLAEETLRGGAGTISTNKTPMSGYLQGPSFNHLASEGNTSQVKMIPNYQKIGEFSKSRLKYQGMPVVLPEGTQTSEIATSLETTKQGKEFLQLTQKDKKANGANIIHEIQNLQHVDQTIPEVKHLNLHDRIHKPDISFQTSPASGLGDHTEEGHSSPLQHQRDTVIKSQLATNPQINLEKGQDTEVSDIDKSINCLYNVAVPVPVHGKDDDTVRAEKTRDLLAGVQTGMTAPSPQLQQIPMNNYSGMNLRNTTTTPTIQDVNSPEDMRIVSNQGETYTYNNQSSQKNFPVAGNSRVTGWEKPSPVGPLSKLTSHIPGFGAHDGSQLTNMVSTLPNPPSEEELIKLILQRFNAPDHYQDKVIKKEQFEHKKVYISGAKIRSPEDKFSFNQGAFEFGDHSNTSALERVMGSGMITNPPKQPKQSKPSNDKKGKMFGLGPEHNR